MGSIDRVAPHFANGSGRKGLVNMFDPLRSKTRVLLYVMTGTLLGVGGASALGWTASSLLPEIRSDPQVADQDVQVALDLSNAFITLSETVTPAVIRIEAERPGTTASGAPQMEVPEEFRDLLPPFFDFPQRGPDQEPTPQTSGGSGFIVSPDGYILTNDHVVSGASRIRVFLSDRREFTAEIVGTDPTTDVAVIKINGEDLPTLSLGSSSDLRVGEWVLAIGNPGFGGASSSLDYTVTAGIVSALGRPLSIIRGELGRQEAWAEVANFAIEDFIQTDAVINPGNSGGPLVNVRGQVIGINTAIASRTGFYQGYGFAIPMDLSRRIMEDLIEFGEVRRAYLGIEMQPVDPVDAEYYGLPRTTGVLIQNVRPDSPAAAAGLRQEDVIVAVDGIDIERSAQLQSTIAQRRPGDRVTVRFYRDGTAQEVSVQLDLAPLQPRVSQARTPEVRVQSLLGMEFTEMDRGAAAELGYDLEGGVIVSGVSPTGPAGRRGVQRGELVEAINNAQVESVSDVESLLSDLGPGAIVSLRLGRPDGSSRVVNLRVPQ